MQLPMLQKSPNLHDLFMDHIVSLLYMKLELKSDQLIALKSGLFVWHSIKHDVQNKFLTPGHGSHKPQVSQSKTPPFAKHNRRQSANTDRQDKHTVLGTGGYRTDLGEDTHYKDRDV